MKQRASLRNVKLHVTNIYQDDWEEIYAIFLTRAKDKGYVNVGIFADIIHDMLDATRELEPGFTNKGAALLREKEATA